MKKIINVKKMTVGMAICMAMTTAFAGTAFAEELTGEFIDESKEELNGEFNIEEFGEEFKNEGFDREIKDEEFGEGFDEDFKDEGFDTQEGSSAEGECGNSESNNSESGNEGFGTETVISEGAGINYIDLETLLDEYDADMKNGVDFYQVKTDWYYIIKTDWGHISFLIPNTTFVRVNRVFEKQQLFGTQRMAEVTLLDTGETVTVPMISGYGFYEAYKVDDPKHHQTIRDIIGW